MAPDKMKARKRVLGEHAGISQLLVKFSEKISAVSYHHNCTLYLLEGLQKHKNGSMLSSKNWCIFCDVIILTIENFFDCQMETSE